MSRRYTFGELEDGDMFFSPLNGLYIKLAVHSEYGQNAVCLVSPDTEHPLKPGRTTTFKSDTVVRLLLEDKE